MTLFAADGSLNVTVVDGNSYTGAQAADGSLNVLVVDGTDYTGLLAGCGAVNVIAAVADSNSYFHPCGAWYISESPYYTGAVKVTVMSGSIGGSSLTAPVLTWDGETLDLTPDFAIDLTAPAVSDIITMRRSTDVGFTTYDDATETVSSIGPVVLSGAFDFGGDWTPGTWYVKVSVTRGVDTSAFSNIETITLTSSASLRVINGGDFRVINGGDFRSVA